MLLKITVQEGNISDREGGKLLLLAITGMFLRLSHLFVDGGYKGEQVTWVKETLGWTVEVVQHRYAGPKGFWLAEGQELTPEQLAVLKSHHSFKVLPRRWVVERTFAQVSLPDAGTMCLTYDLPLETAQQRLRIPAREQ